MRERALMERRARTRRFAPGVDLLDSRQLLSGGVTASLSHAVLTVQGSSPSVPIEVDILPTGASHGPGRMVVVPGVAQFPGTQVRKIQVMGVVGEPISVVHPGLPLRIPVRISRVGGETVPSPAPVASQSTPTAPTSDAPSSMSTLEQAVVDLTNQARAQNGLPPLQANSALVASAQIQSANMARLNQLEHVLPGVALPTLQSRAMAVGYPYAWLGENIAFNYADAPSVVTAWMNSPEHRANILNPNYTDIGVSIAWNSLGQAYATQDFGSRRSS